MQRRGTGRHAAFDAPHAGTPDELAVLALRQSLEGENQAIYDYQNWVNQLPEGHPVREGLIDIMREERAHVGELQQMLFQINPAESNDFEDGKREVGAMAGRRSLGNRGSRQPKNCQAALFSKTCMADAPTVYDFDLFGGEHYGQVCHMETGGTETTCLVVVPSKDMRGRSDFTTCGAVFDENGKDGIGATMVFDGAGRFKDYRNMNGSVKFDSVDDAIRLLPSITVEDFFGNVAFASKNKRAFTGGVNRGMYNGKNFKRAEFHGDITDVMADIGRMLRQCETFEEAKEVVDQELSGIGGEDLDPLYEDYGAEDFFSLVDAIAEKLWSGKAEARRKARAIRAAYHRNADKLASAKRIKRAQTVWNEYPVRLPRDKSQWDVNGSYADPQYLRAVNTEYSYTDGNGIKYTILEESQNGGEGRFDLSYRPSSSIDRSSYFANTFENAVETLERHTNEYIEAAIRNNDATYRGELYMGSRIGFDERRGGIRKRAYTFDSSEQDFIDAVAYRLEEHAPYRDENDLMQELDRIVENNMQYGNEGGMPSPYWTKEDVKNAVLDEIAIPALVASRNVRNRALRANINRQLKESDGSMNKRRKRAEFHGDITDVMAGIERMLGQCETLEEAKEIVDQELNGIGGDDLEPLYEDYGADDFFGLVDAIAERLWNGKVEARRKAMAIRAAYHRNSGSIKKRAQTVGRGATKSAKQRVADTITSIDSYMVGEDEHVDRWYRIDDMPGLYAYAPSNGGWLYVVGDGYQAGYNGWIVTNTPDIEQNGDVLEENGQFAEFFLEEVDPMIFDTYIDAILYCNSHFGTKAASKGARGAYAKKMCSSGKKVRTASPYIELSNGGKVYLSSSSDYDPDLAHVYLVDSNGETHSDDVWNFGVNDLVGAVTDYVQQYVALSDSDLDAIDQLVNNHYDNMFGAPGYGSYDKVFSNRKHVRAMEQRPRRAGSVRKATGCPCEMGGGTNVVEPLREDFDELSDDLSTDKPLNGGADNPPANIKPGARVCRSKRGGLRKRAQEADAILWADDGRDGMEAELSDGRSVAAFETSDGDYCWELYLPNGDYADGDRHFDSIEDAMSAVEKRYNLYRMASRLKPAKQTRQSFRKRAQEADEDKSDDLPEFLEEEDRGDDEEDEEEDEEPAEEDEGREARRAAVRKAMKAARSKAQKRSAAKADEPEKNKPQMRQPVRVQKRSANVAGKPSATYDDTCLFM